MNSTLQGVPKILLKEMCDLNYLKMLPLAFKITIFRKCSLYMRILKFLIAKEKFPLKKGNF